MKKIVLGTIALTALTLSGCKPPQDAKAATSPLDTTIAEKEALPVEAVIAGAEEVSKTVRGAVTTAGIREAYLSAKQSGAITSVPAKLGDRLKRGATILTVESQVFRAANTQAEVGVEQAQLNFNAVEKLYQKGSVSEAEFIQAKSVLASAKAGLEMSKYNYSNCWLRAPFAGALTYLDPVAEKGNMIGAGTPVARLVDISQLKVTLYLGESDIVHIAQGNRATVTIPALGISLDGTVSAVSEGSDPSTGAFSVEVITDNPDRIVKAGMTGTAAITTNQSESGIVVPASAVVIRGDNRSVMKLEDGKARSIAVSATLISGNRMMITGDVAEGDTLIATGLTRLMTGDPVVATVVEL